MIAAKLLPVIWGLVFIGQFTNGYGYYFPKFNFPILKTTFKSQKMPELSNQVCGYIVHYPCTLVDKILHESGFQTFGLLITILKEFSNK